MHPTSVHHPSLTRSDKNYSMTEKELLAIVWAFTKLHTYMYGYFVIVERDLQPPLSLICKKHPPSCLL